MRPTQLTGDGRPAGGRPASTTDHRPDRAFLAAGAALLASVVVPRLGAAHSTAGHVVGVALVGVAGACAAAGLLGLVLALEPTRLTRVGAAAAAVAGLGAAGLLVGTGVVALGSDPAALTTVSTAVVFRTVALLTAGGLALGYLAVGLAHRQADDRRRAGTLLALGGVGLGLPAVTVVAGVDTPGWLVFAALGTFTLASLTAGAVLRPQRA